MSRLGHSVALALAVGVIARVGVAALGSGNEAVAVITPGGLGVREGALVLLLTPLTGSRVALALAIASRVLFTVAELLAAAPFLLWRDRAASPSAPRSAP